ncbi:MAG: UDP-N-acetylmuramoyl-L-alanine--D-glutamate ligase [Patescibacteria group bacterium]
MNYKDKKVAVLGWGVDTKDVSGWLLKQGAKITVFDKKSEIEKDNRFEWRLGQELFEDLEGFDVAVRSPGIYRHRKDIVEAEKAGVEITSKTKIFFDVCPARIIGVTGTKGKGTTSTLIYEMLKKGGKDVYLAGNIGLGMFEYFDKLTTDSWMVLELSSAQLIDLHKSPHIAAIVMTTSDHLDWHKDQQEYWDAKANLTRYQTDSDWAVINNGYEGSRWVGSQGKGKKVFASPEDFVGDVRMKGEHQRQNVAVAAAVAKIVGVDEKIVHKVAAAFKGLEHRLEEVATVNGVTYYDDSISTVPETAIAAIKSFSENIVLIAGGSEKNSDFSELGKEIVNCGHMRGVILIGEMTDRIEKAIEQAGGGIKIVKGLKTMRRVVQEAENLAKKGDVVALSPAAASFGMFKNYKDRGNQFKKEVERLSTKS